MNIINSLFNMGLAALAPIGAAICCLWSALCCIIPEFMDRHDDFKKWFVSIGIILSIFGAIALFLES